VTLTAVANEKSSPGPQRTPARLVALAASAGGIHAIGVVLSTLPSDLPAPVVVVQHLAPRHPSHMAAIMTRQTQLDVRQARDGEVLRNGVVYIAPPDRHLLVNTDGSVTLADTELVHFLRPSADLLFESAAAACGPGLVAVVLSGTGEDGAMGIRAVKKMGGLVIVQDEISAEFTGMPRAAIGTGIADRVLELRDIGPAIATLIRLPLQ
jgi:two-component system chemotaxis response regulator CheB